MAVVPRCTECRNPVKTHHARKQHPRTGEVFHQDCWESTQGAIQQNYLKKIGEDGLEGLLSPYVCTTLHAPFVPEQRVDEPVQGEPAVAAVLETPADGLEDCRDAVVLEDGVTAFAMPAQPSRPGTVESVPVESVPV